MTFYSFEGIDACGKGTQIEYARKYFERKNIPVAVVREPGETALGEVLRMIIKRPLDIYKVLQEESKYHYDSRIFDITEQRSPLSEILLFLAAREEFVKKVVLPNLIEGKVILADRFADSTVAYQGYGRFYGNQIILDFIDNAHSIMLGDNWPTRTFYLDIPISEMYRRTKRRLDTMESSGEEFFERTQNGYLRCAQKNPQRIITIDGTLPEREIFEQHILPVLKQDIL